MVATDIFSVINILTNLALLIFIVFYLIKLRGKEEELRVKENKIDADYHHVIDAALAKERKILDDSTAEASEIITGASYINQGIKKNIDEALQKMIDTLNQGTSTTSTDFINYYHATLKQLTLKSLSDFETIYKSLETDLEKQIKDFRETLLPNLEKEIESYKQARLKEVEGAVKSMVEKVALEVLNKSIAQEDQEKLVIECLEKAKAEGMFT